MRSCFVFMILLATACTQSTVIGPDASLVDAGSAHDAATHPDASMPMDASTAHDASPVPDSATPDATTSDDAGTPAFCRLPPDPGSCLAYIERYAFNPKAHACELFVYGGCMGNANNFEKPLDCLAACVTGSDAGVQLAACKIGDQVFASGATGIKDPHSCNRCSCDDGQLACTKLECSEECPPDRKASVGCAACGPVDNCELVEYGCFKVCDTLDDCRSTPQAVCVDNACKNVCG